MPTHAQVPPTQRQQTGRVNDLLPLGDWIRHHSLRSWPVLLFLALICVPSVALVMRRAAWDIAHLGDGRRGAVCHGGRIPGRQGR